MGSNRKTLRDLPYFISGVSFEVMRNYDHNSRKKIEQIGGFVLIPVIMWFLTGYAASSLLGGNFYSSMFSGLFAGVFIFFIERSLILAKNAHWIMLLIRLILGILIAAIGSFFLDVRIFNSDIEKLAYENFETEFKSRKDAAFKMLNTTNEALYKEMIGTGGSRKRGFGPISDELKLQQRKQEFLIAEIDSIFLHEKTALFDSKNPDHQKVRTKLGMNTLAYKMELFHILIEKDPISKTVWIMMLIAGLIFELLPILSKSLSKPSAFELDAEAHEIVLANRRKSILRKSNMYASMSNSDATIQRLIDRSLN